MINVIINQNTNDSPTYSFKNELREFGKQGIVTLDEPITFTSDDVLITGFDSDVVYITNNVIGKSYTYRWEQVGYKFSRKLYEIIHTI